MLPSAGEFNRLDRDGDYMEGDLDLIEISHPTAASIIRFLATVGGIQAGGIRQNGNDMEFYDLTVGAWISLSSLSGKVGMIDYHVAGAGQTVFVLASPYTVGANTLQVIVNGLRWPGPGAVGPPSPPLPLAPLYAETNPTTVTFGAAPDPPWLPFVGGELVIFYEPAQPNVFDTYNVKGDAVDGTPLDLNQKISGSGAVVKSVTGSPANSVVDLDVPFSVAAPPADGGVGAVGVSTNVARQDHQHPADDFDNLVAKVQGEVPYYGAAGAPSRLAPANLGDVLTCQGAGADPAWQAPAITDYAMSQHNVVPVGISSAQEAVDTIADATPVDVTLDVAVFKLATPKSHLIVPHMPAHQLTSFNSGPPYFTYIPGGDSYVPENILITGQWVGATRYSSIASFLRRVTFFQSGGLWHAQFVGAHMIRYQNGPVDGKSLLIVTWNRNTGLQILNLSIPNGTGVTNTFSPLTTLFVVRENAAEDILVETYDSGGAPANYAHSYLYGRLYQAGGYLRLALRARASTLFGGGICGSALNIRSYEYE
ncbi:MAG: hypothetical protein AMS21_00760 [Gemmatimonas sp. SG8_38_2]|nr:MAG: hypothetical protein AMS21_00760 [Gemmatimonas sp. SG8_38_2]